MGKQKESKVTGIRYNVGKRLWETPDGCQFTTRGKAENHIEWATRSVVTEQKREGNE
jgi:hypothetical protein